MAFSLYTLASIHSPTENARSTIDVSRLNFCVRDGNRCDPRAINTKECLGKGSGAPLSRPQGPPEKTFRPTPSISRFHASLRKTSWLLFLVSHKSNQAPSIHVLDAGEPLRLTVLKAVRPISIARLHGLLRFHLRPIDLVVFEGSLRGSRPTGELFSGGASRLDAFSVYPVRTWLLHVAPGGTMDTPAVRPTRSSRTRVSFLQLSNAHTG